MTKEEIANLMLDVAEEFIKDITKDLEIDKDTKEDIQIICNIISEFGSRVVDKMQEKIIDKENPKAPIPTPMAHLYGTYNCPNCKNPLPMKHNALKKKVPRLYCDRCGQKIDWDMVKD